MKPRKPASHLLDRLSSSGDESRPVVKDALAGPSLMSKRLGPSMSSLRAFSVVSSELSFKAAAEALSVTPSALSMQIKNLEEHLGASLFIRKNRSLELTEIGKEISPLVQSAFRDLNRACELAKGSLRADRLTVTTGPAFTSKWLAPRLGEFAREHPKIELLVSTTLKKLDFSRDGIDVAVRFSDNTDTSYYCEPILDEWVVPVAHPMLAAQLRQPEDLCEATLVHDDSLDFIQRDVGWNTWFEANGLLGQQPSEGTRFNQADHAIEVALQGDGVVLARYSFVRHSIEAGVLVAPFPVALQVPAQFFLVCPHGSEGDQNVKAFRDWMHRVVTKEGGPPKHWRILEL